MKVRTMESAPKDGQMILLYGEVAGEIHGPTGEQEWAVGCWMYDGKTDYQGYHWRICATDAYSVWIKPTAWAKLPKEPS